MTVSPIRFSTTPRRLVVGLFVLFTACHKQAPAPAPSPAPSRTRAPAPTREAIDNGNALLRAMRERYPNWYRTLTFVQRTTITPPSGGELVQTWYEAGELPGRLRIDTDLSTKSGTLFARDSIYSFSAGKLVRADSGLNALLVLGFDVYRQPAARTEAQLRRLGFKLGTIHEATWRGRPVYVVGATRGDSTTKQFWVDKQDLLFLRLLERGPQGHVDVRFEKYARVGQGWIAMQVVQLVNGKQRLIEEYSDVHVNVPLDADLFSPSDWASAEHWAKPTGARRH